MEIPIICIVLLAITATVKGFPQHVTSIPNGDSVPDPCNPGQSWARVGGHRREGAGGGLNPFGVDFEAANFVWTTELCKKDSDMDGDSNGKELGDPECKWSKFNDAIKLLPGDRVTHPGICDPIYSEKCIKFNDFPPESCPELIIIEPTPPPPVCGDKVHGIMGTCMPCKQCKGKKVGLWKCPKLSKQCDGKKMCCCMKNKPPRKHCKNMKKVPSG